MKSFVNQYVQRPVSAAPLAVFRVILGGLIFLSIIRFWANGWIGALYIEPQYFFPFYGFEFVKPLGGYTYVLFAICAIAALLVALGLFYRVAIWVLFLSFTYIELMDKSTYLNHYYFVSMVCLLMIFLPAHRWFSLDTFRRPELATPRIPIWSINVVKLFVCIVYFFAGLAKVNSDWLLHALPLRIWLPAKNDLILIGPLLSKEWIAYVFSWAGCLYDLTIPFLLLNARTRPLAFAAVVIFHLLTWILFPIGMFPFIMIGTALIFLTEDFHLKVVSRVRRLFSWIPVPSSRLGAKVYHRDSFRGYAFVLIPFFVVQLVLPFRYLAYPGELFWTEEGYRFSWRVMLMEKAGYAQFTVADNKGRRVTVNNAEFLTPLQEKMMAVQPDMILQYAHILDGHYKGLGFDSPRVFVDSYVSVNGRLGKVLVDPGTDLVQLTDSFNHKSWVLPFGDDIKGF